MKCPYCNNNLEESAVFCGYCGKSLSSSREADLFNSGTNLSTQKTDEKPKSGNDSSEQKTSKNRNQAKWIYPALIFTGPLVLIILVYLIWLQPKYKEDKIWKGALSYNTLSAYEIYQKNYPQGNYIFLCEEKIDSINRSADSIKKIDPQKTQNVLIKNRIKPTTVLQEKAENKPIPGQTVGQTSSKATTQTTTQTKATTIIKTPAQSPVQTTTQSQPAVTATTTNQEATQTSTNLNKEVVEDNSIYQIPEVKPQFPGGDSKMNSFLNSNLRYPVKASENGIQGTVYVNFVVEKNGAITNVKAIKFIGAGCDEEAVRVIRTMPNWISGKQKGKDVRSQYTLPIKFKLTNLR